MKTLSLRARLTLWYTLALLVMLLLFVLGSFGCGAAGAKAG